MIGSTLWQLVVKSDLITQLVLAFLCGMSCLSWIIFLYKSYNFFQKRKQINKAIQLIKKSHSLSDMQNKIEMLGVGELYLCVKSIIEECLPLIKLYQKPVEQSNSSMRMQQIKLCIQSCLEEESDKEESLVWVLSTVASAATLLGLFGTVWGLIHAFLSISQQQSADIVTIAPGIAQALITTLVGLLVAIPALILFNYLSMQLVKVESYYMQLESALSKLVQQEVV